MIADDRLGSRRNPGDSNLFKDSIAHTPACIHSILQCNLKDSMASALTTKEGLEKQLCSAKESFDKERSLTTAAESKLSAAGEHMHVYIHQSSHACVYASAYTHLGMMRVECMHDYR